MTTRLKDLDGFPDELPFPIGHSVNGALLLLDDTEDAFRVEMPVLEDSPQPVLQIHTDDPALVIGAGETIRVEVAVRASQEEALLFRVGSDAILTFDSDDGELALGPAVLAFGIFGAAPVGQQPIPSDLPETIAVLQAFGFVEPT